MKMKSYRYLGKRQNGTTPEEVLLKHMGQDSFRPDYAFTNQIVVRLFPDGPFRYLSDTVEQKELELSQTGK